MVVFVFLFFLVILSVSFAKSDDTQDATSGVDKNLTKRRTVILFIEP